VKEVLPPESVGGDEDDVASVGGGENSEEEGQKEGSGMHTEHIGMVH
jgi:hypothetical protein